jgi:hypothetical protein
VVCAFWCGFADGEATEPRLTTAPAGVLVRVVRLRIRCVVLICRLDDRVRCCPDIAVGLLAPAP